MAPIPSLIYDVGLNIGEDSAYYLREGFDVVAIEANPVLVELVRRRFARYIHLGRLTVLGVGIAEGEGEATFWICDDNSGFSSFDRALASREGARHHAITVSLRSFESIVLECGMPYYCKIDIEGNDRLCLAEMTPQHRPSMISVEVSDHSLVDQCARIGYDRFKLVHQRSYAPPNLRLQAIKARAPYLRIANALERANGLLRGSVVDRGWYFKRGSSGPLPERTVGPWLALEEIREDLAWAAENELACDWWDLHATSTRS